MKKFLSLILAAVLLFSLVGCSAGYEKTEQTERALALYTEAVKKNESMTAGKITVNIKSEDTVVRKNTMEQTHHYTYTLDGDDENFEYKSLEKGKVYQHLVSDKAEGERVVTDKLNDSQNEQFSYYLSHKTNPMSTLKLFRMDANYKLQHSTIASIKLAEGDKTVITVSFHGDKLTGTVVKSENGLRRTVVSHTRVYTIEDGALTKIEIYDRENAEYDGATGVLNTDTVVEIAY